MQKAPGGRSIGRDVVATEMNVRADAGILQLNTIAVHQAVPRQLVDGHAAGMGGGRGGVIGIPPFPRSE